MAVRLRRIKRRSNNKSPTNRTRFIKISKKRKKRRGKPVPANIRRLSFDQKAKAMKKLCGSSRYKKWRRAVFKRDGYRCAVCGTKEYLEGHHILRKWDFPELMFTISNGMTLCGPSTKKTTCHGKVTGREYEAIGSLLESMKSTHRVAFTAILKEKGIK